MALDGRTCLGVLAITLITLATPSGSSQTPAAFDKQRVSFKSGSLTLAGFLFKPSGPGPFPALVWNHGSERNPGTGPQFDTIAGIFVPAGYVVFAPMRRGHGFSEGRYITDQIDEIRKTRGAAAAEQAVVHLLETEQLDDQIAGLDYVKHLDFVDTTRLAVAGCSYGGIQTLLGAERGIGYKAAVSISPAALSWAGNPLLRDRLLRAVRGIEIPVMLLQPAKDASLEPSRVLGAEFTRLRKPFTGKIYPADGPPEEQTHCFGGARGFHVWGADAVSVSRGAPVEIEPGGDVRSLFDALRYSSQAAPLRWLRRQPCPALAAHFSAPLRGSSSAPGLPRMASRARTTGSASE